MTIKINSGATVSYYKPGNKKTKSVVSKTKDTKSKKQGKIFGLEIYDPLEYLPSGYLSVSQIEMYLRCARQYEFRYIKKMKLPPAVPLVEGISHHNTIEMDIDNKFEKGDNLSLKIIQEKFCDSFSEESKNIPKIEWQNSGETEKSIISRGKDLLKNYNTGVAKKICPVTLTEQKFEILVGDIPMIGFIDIIDKKGLVDVKVVKSVKSQYEADNDIQLTMYSKSMDIESVSFCCFTKTINRDIKFVSSIRGERDYKALEMIIVGVADAIKKGAFPMCDPTKSFPCSERWCGYWKMCRGRYIR